MCSTIMGCAITTRAKHDIAKQEFSDYVKFYPNTDLAGNAYFYLAEIAYKEGNFQEAVTNYDQVLQNFPTGNKAPSADLKKALALIELGKKDDGITELRHVIERYPRSNEALQARDRLRKLGVSTTAAREPRRIDYPHQLSSGVNAGVMPRVTAVIVLLIAMVASTC